MVRYEKCMQGRLARADNFEYLRAYKKMSEYSFPQGVPSIKAQDIKIHDIKVSYVVHEYFNCVRTHAKESEIKHSSMHRW